MKLIYRKLIASTISIPFLYNTVWAYKWQIERKVWKEEMIQKRIEKLSRPIQNVQLDQIPAGKISKEQFEEEWLYRPISISGVFDHSAENLIVRTRNEERGYEVITPLYTKVEHGQLQGIFINRGRIPMEYKDSRMHYTPSNKQETVEGILMPSESEQNDKQYENVTKNSHIRIDLEKFKNNFANKDLAMNFYLKSTQFTMDGTIEQQRLPRQAIPSDLCYWYVTPQKHQAYASFWFYLSCLNAGCLAYVWLVM